MKKLFTLLLLFSTTLIWSQKYKFGKVSKAELEEKVHPLDATANAAILYSERRTSFEYTYDKGFFIREEYYVRLKIYNEEGYKYATKEIATYHNNNREEKVLAIKARTYNLENGKIEKTKLKGSNVFDEEKNKFYNIMKFTMPNLKPGSVVEWKYTFETPFKGMLDEVELQGDIPINKISVRLAIPEYFGYAPKRKGYFTVPISNKKRKRTVNYTYRQKSEGFDPHQSGQRVTNNQTSSLEFDETIYEIEQENIPALKEESFSGNMNNYKSGIKYELTFIKYPNSPIESYSTDWESVAKKMYFSPLFGDQIKKHKHFDDDLSTVLEGEISLDAKIIKTFNFVKSKIKWNEYYGAYSDEGVKKAYKKGVGNVADINLNLVAMLKSIGVDANPVLVSTESHGIPLFPTRTGFNYVIVKAKTSNGYVLLDATEKNSLPNILPSRVLNFQGREITDDGKSQWVKLFPATHSAYQASISAKLNEENISGTARTTITNGFLYSYRNEARGLSAEGLLNWIDGENKDIEVLNARVSNLDKLGKDGVEMIKFETESFFEEIAGKLYVTPLLYKQETESPFKSEKREFPVFFKRPRAFINTIALTIPDSYTVESLPEPLEISLPDNMGVFTYSITKDNNTITTKSNFVINASVVPASNYNDLKEFYKKTIEKQAEKIVLVKK